MSAERRFLDTNILLYLHSADVVKAERALATRYSLSVYDAMVVASALQADCQVLYSEDMQHGLRPGAGLRVVNPFV